MALIGLVAPVIILFALVGPALMMLGILVWLWHVASTDPDRPRPEPSPPCCYCGGDDTVLYIGGFICRACLKVVAPAGSLARQTWH